MGSPSKAITRKITPRRTSARIADALLWIYKATLGSILGSRCRFSPSCGTYVRDAVCTHGIGRGLKLGVWRILRCNPCTRGGFDPVPGLCEEKSRSN